MTNGCCVKSGVQHTKPSTLTTSATRSREPRASPRLCKQVQYACLRRGLALLEGEVVANPADVPVRTLARQEQQVTGEPPAAVSSPPAGATAAA